MCTAPLIPLCSPKQARTPTALALGSFDGLHRGHQLVIDEIVKNANGDIPTVVSFWPHPREVLYSESRLRLDLPEEKTSLLAPLGVQQLVLIPFTRSLAALSAEAFVKTMLVETLQAHRIAVGANFRFGRNREGDTNSLKQFAAESGVEVVITPIFKDSEGRMSSSRIRSALSKGDLQSAKVLMGRPYRFRGQVVKGRGIGSGIGWPTANLEVDGRKFLPELGVYAAWAWINHEETPLPAIMNLGPQPTVDPASPSAVEVHILNKNLNLEGNELLIEPVERLRSQRCFSTIEELAKQIGLDAQLAQSKLSSIKGNI